MIQPRGTRPSMASTPAQADQKLPNLKTTFPHRRINSLAHGTLAIIRVGEHCRRRAALVTRVNVWRFMTGNALKRIGFA